VDDHETAAGRAFVPAVLGVTGSPAETDAMDEPNRSYDDLIRPVEPLMMRSIWRIIRQREAAEDAFQDALAIVWRKRAAVARHPNPRALILKISLAAAYDALRRSSRRLRHETAGLPLQAGDAAEAPDGREAEARALRRAVMDAIAGLPRRQATAALLRLVEDQPYPDIAVAMGCSEATVRIHVMRARQALARRLADFRPGPDEPARKACEEAFR